MSHRTPAQIKKFLKDYEHRLESRVQYFGDEPNSYRRDWDSSTVRACIFANWTYEQAAGNQAVPLVYRVINEHSPKFLADRAYWWAQPRDLTAFETHGIPQFGIESKHQLADFDVIGTSISYPVLTINFVKTLLASDIPPTREDRWQDGEWVAGRERDPERWPMVMVGGQSYGGPEVSANIVDCFFLGEVEDEPGNPGLGAVLERIEVFKADGRWSTDRVECYADLAREFNFLYFPRFVDVHYGYEQRPSVDLVVESLDESERFEPRPSKQVIGYTANIDGMRLPCTKRIVKDFNAVEGLVNPPLLYIDPGMGSGDAEVARGCPAWCSFCALTFRQKPYRQRSVEYMEDFSKELLQNTGGMHISPFSPDFPMFTEKKRLLDTLLTNVVDDVDASSMRVDDFIADPSYILLQAHGGMDTVTLGVEGNSQRMRDLVGKGAADEDIKEAVARGISAGLTKFKLYMIAALPGEDEGDIFRILTLARDLANLRDSMGSKARIQFSWTPLLIEANTPLQWFAPTPIDYALGDVWEEFRDLKIDFKLGSKSQRDKQVYYQLSQRASREIGMAMVECVAEMNAGCWGGTPKGLWQMMEQALRRRGFLNGRCDAYDERDKADMFGWEMVDQGINVELMWVTFQQMREFLETTDSETYDANFGDQYHGNEWIERCDTKCYGKSCGVCDATDLKLRRGYIEAAAREVHKDLADVKVIDQRSVVQRVRLKVHKSTEKRFVMNDHFRYALRRAAYRAGLPITKRTVRFATDSLNFKDWTCGTDYVEFGLTQKVTPEALKLFVAAMNLELEPSNALRIEDWSIYPPRVAPLRQDVDLSLYEMEVDTSPDKATKAIENWKAADYVKMVIRNPSLQHGGQQMIEVNGKDLVEDLWLARDGHRLLLKSLIRGKANPYMVYASLFEKPSWIEAAKYPAVRLDAFIDADPDAYDFFRSACPGCSRMVPVSPIDQPYGEYCPQCTDQLVLA